MQNSCPRLLNCDQKENRVKIIHELLANAFSNYTSLRTSLEEMRLGLWL